MHIHQYITTLVTIAILLGFSHAAHSEIPDAIASLPLHEWRSISLNTLSDVDPCPDNECAWSGVEGQSAVINEWTGGAYASEFGPIGGLIYAGGGHNSYYGNEVYVFDLQTLLWQRRNDPTDGQIPGDASTMKLDNNCRYWDGTPVVAHTYDSVVYDPETNRFIMLTPSDADSYILPGLTNGCSSTTPAYFDFKTNAWENMKSVGPADITDGPTAYDGKRKLFWGRTGYRDPRLFVSYNPATDIWKQYPDDDIAIDSVGAIDPTRDIFVAADFREHPQIAVLDLSKPSQPATIIKTVGDTQIEQRHGLGFEWAPKLGGFIAWNDGLNLYLLTPPSENWHKQNWTWTSITATGENPGEVSNGARSKFQWVDSLGIALISPRANAPVYAIRLVKN